MTQKSIMAGRLSADPDVRYSPDEVATCSFPLKVQDGKEEKEIHCTATGGIAKVCGEYLTKGKLVAVEGKLQTKSFIGKTGKKTSRTELVVQDMQMLDSEFFKRKLLSER